MRITSTLLSSIIGLSALFIITPAQADYDCELEDMGQAIDCADNAVKIEKSRLNNVYMDIYRTLNSNQKRKMDNEQLAWLAERDAECLTPEEDMARGNMAVWQEISDSLCIAHKNSERSDYYQNVYQYQKTGAQALSTSTSSTSTASTGTSLGNATGFRKVASGSDSYITNYRGMTTVSGVLNVTEPDDDYTPCGLCFTVSDRDSDKIPREAGDSRGGWFAFTNTKYDEATKSYQLADLRFNSRQCYKPMKATIEIAGYTADRAETETVDTTTLVKVISIDKPQVIACPVY